MSDLAAAVLAPGRREIKPKGKILFLHNTQAFAALPSTTDLSHSISEAVQPIRHASLTRYPRWPLQRLVAGRCCAC